MCGRYGNECAAARIACCGLSGVRASPDRNPMKHPSCAAHDVCPQRPWRRVRRLATLCAASAFPVLAFAQAKSQPDGATAQLDFHDVFKRLDTTGVLLIALA